MEKEENQNNTVKDSREPDNEATNAEESLDTENQKNTDQGVELKEKTEESTPEEKIVELEDKLLRELSQSTGNILDNDDLIKTLDDTKSTAVEITGKLEQSKFTKDEISKTRLQYTPVAKRGSILYFAESGLAAINSMYEISLDSFLGVFLSALGSANSRPTS